MAVREPTIYYPLVDPLLNYEPRHDHRKSMIYKYYCMSLGRDYLLDQWIRETVCRKNPPLEYLSDETPNLMSESDRRPNRVQLTPVSLERLRAYNPEPNLCPVSDRTCPQVFLLDDLMYHAQLLWIDPIKRQFMIIDPLSDRPDLVQALRDQIQVELGANHGGGYRPLMTPIPRGPQDITQGMTCGAWSLFLAHLICRTQDPPDQVIKALVQMRPANLHRLVRGVINYSYDQLADQPELLKALSRLIQTNDDRIYRRRYLVGPETITGLAHEVCTLALKGEQRNLVRMVEAAITTWPTNRLYELLVGKSTSPLAKLYLHLVSEHLNIDPTNADEPFYQWIVNGDLSASLPRVHQILSSHYSRNQLEKVLIELRDYLVGEVLEVKPGELEMLRIV